MDSKPAKVIHIIMSYQINNRCIAQETQTR